MKKIIAYSFLLVLMTFFVASYLGSAKDAEKHIERIDNDIEKNTFNAKRHLIKYIDSGLGYVLLDKAKNESTSYKIYAYVGGGKYDLLEQDLVYYPEENYSNNPDYIMHEDQGAGHEMQFSDTLRNIHIDEIRKQIYDSPEVFSDFQIDMPDDNSDEFIGQIDDSLLVFLFIAFLIMIGLLILEFPIYLIKRYWGRDSRLWVYMGAFSLLVVFFQTMMTPGLWPQVPIETVLRPILLFLPTFIVYQWFSKRYESLDFLNQQLIKFLLIFFVGFIGIYLADRFSLYVASTQERGVVISNTIWLIAMTYSFALGNLLYNLVRQGWSLRRSDKKLAIAKKQVLSSESALNTVQSSVNPHFLYNSLNSIAALAKESPEKTEKMAHALSDFYRYHTNRDGQAMTTVNEEIEMIQSYLGIEKIRFEERLVYSLDIDDTLLDLEIPHFLLQPLVENAIKYGYNSVSEKIELLLEIKTDGQDLIINLKDKGVDFTDDLQKGFGLKSVTDKLKLSFPDSHEISFINQPEKKVHIKIMNHV